MLLCSDWPDQVLLWTSVPSKEGWSLKLYWRIKVNDRWTWKPAKVLQRESPGRDFVVVETIETEEE